MKIVAKNIVGLKELRGNIETYINRVEKGKSFIVVRRSRPIFKVIPVDEWGDEGVWKTVADFSKIRKGGIPASDVIRALKRLNEQGR